MSDLSAVAAPEGAAPAAPDAGPAGSAPEGVTPGAPPAPSAPEGTGAPAAPEGAAATAESHGSEEAANTANAEAALAGSKVALDALPAPVQSYIKQLRDEAAESRVKAKPFTDSFQGLEPQEQEWLLSLARDLGQGETQAEAARRMQAVAQSLLEGVEPPADETKPLTMADYQRIQAEQKAKAEQEQAIQSVFDEAKELGYEKNTPDFALLMWLAANAEKAEEAGDLKAAHKRIEDGRRAIIDSYVAEQKAKGAGFPAQAAGGAPGQQATPPTGWKDARARAEARAAAAKAALGTQSR